MFHMTKNITCILEQIEFHLETSEMNLYNMYCKFLF